MDAGTINDYEMEIEDTFFIHIFLNCIDLLNMKVYYYNLIHLTIHTVTYIQHEK